MPTKTTQIDELDTLRFALAKTRCGESSAVIGNLQLSLQRETAIGQQRQHEFNALGAGLRKKYGLSEQATIEVDGENAGLATDPAPPEAGAAQGEAQGEEKPAN